MGLLSIFKKKPKWNGTCWYRVEGKLLQEVKDQTIALTKYHVLREIVLPIPEHSIVTEARVTIYLIGGDQSERRFEMEKPKTQRLNSIGQVVVVATRRPLGTDCLKPGDTVHCTIDYLGSTRSLVFTFPKSFEEAKE